MASKSKRNRRYPVQRNAETFKSTGSDTAEPTTVSSVQSQMPVQAYSSTSKRNATPFNNEYLIHDMKWTGLVTAIIIILLIVSFVIFG